MTDLDAALQAGIVVLAGAVGVVTGLACGAIRGRGVTIAVVKLTFMIDHYVAVLDIDATHVTLGDPLDGLVRLSRAEFTERWRRTGVVLRRDSRPGTDSVGVPPVGR